MIRQWLKAGVVEQGRLHRTEDGVPQGGVVSPLLLNVALHGMEAVVTQGSARGPVREQPVLVRYADDFVILQADLGELQQAVKRVKNAKYLLIPASEDTRGHGTTSMAKFYKQQLGAFLASVPARGS